MPRRSLSKPSGWPFRSSLTAPALPLSLLVLAALTGACGSGVPPPPNAGPLVDTSSPTAFCVASSAGGAVAIGWDLLEVRGQADATITSVALLDAHGVRLAGALVVPVLSEQLLGNGWRYPLDASEVAELGPGIEWAQRENAAGAAIRPSTAPGFNLVLGVAPTGRATGTATGAAVSYQANGAQWTLDTKTALTVEVAPNRC